MSNRYQTRADEIFAGAYKFHRQHPEVAVRFDRYTFELIDRGFKHYSASGVWERIRWETPAGADGKEAFKLNNNYRTYYVRTFQKKHPEHAKFFRTRRLKSASKPPRYLPDPTPDFFDDEDEGGATST